MQGGQWIEFPFDRPVSTNDHIGAPHQPNAHDLLQHVAAQLPIGQVQALLKQGLAQRFFIHCIVRSPEAASLAHKVYADCSSHR
jgi:hypothetical protein